MISHDTMKFYDTLKFSSTGWKPVTQNYDNRISFSEWGKNIVYAAR